MYLPYPGLSHEAGPPGNPEQFEYKKKIIQLYVV